MLPKSKTSDSGVKMIFGRWPEAIACEQALRGALAEGREKEGEFATISLKFEDLHRKTRCEMLIGGDDIGNHVITLGACFQVFFNVSLHSRSFGHEN